MSLAKFRKVSKGGDSPKKQLGEPPDFRPKQVPETKDEKNGQK
jgi:hypothetical protein